MTVKNQCKNCGKKGLQRTAALDRRGLDTERGAEPGDQAAQILVLLTHAHEQAADGLRRGGAHVGDGVQQAVLQAGQHLCQVGRQDLGVADHAHLCVAVTSIK